MPNPPTVNQIIEDAYSEMLRVARAAQSSLPSFLRTRHAPEDLVQDAVVQMLEEESSPLPYKPEDYVRFAARRLMKIEVVEVSLENEEYENALEEHVTETILLNPQEPSRVEYRSITQHPLYEIWRGILARCSDPDNPKHSRYAGRGIEVCERWRLASNFYLDIEATIGPRPGTQYSLDRYPDPDGNYEPGNVRWATAQEQSDNKGSR